MNILKVYFHYYRNMGWLKKSLKETKITKDEYLNMIDYAEYLKNHNSYVTDVEYIVKEEAKPNGTDYLYGEICGEEFIIGVCPTPIKSSICITPPLLEYYKNNIPEPYFKMKLYDDERNIISVARISLLNSSYINHENSINIKWVLNQTEKKGLIEVLNKIRFGDFTIWDDIIKEYNKLLQHYFGDNICKKYGYYIPSDLPMPDYTKLQ